MCSSTVATCCLKIALYKMASSSSKPPPPKRRHVLADVAALSGTRASAAKIMKKLHDGGLLKDKTLFATSDRSMRRDASIGTADVIASRTTPYGPVLQQMKLGRISIEVVNPFAYMHCLCNDHPEVFDMIRAGVRFTTKPITMYIDEIDPGNPLRHDKGRTAQCVYWTFTNLPDKFLAAENTWFIITVIRSKTILTVPGKESALMKAILLLFFPADGHSWLSGILLGSGDTAAVVQAHFAGFLADEKALKTVFCLKGAGGTRFCPTCFNVVQFIDLAVHVGSLVGIDCADPSKFITVSDDAFYAAADRLHENRHDKKALASLQQTVGMNYEPDGILYDKHIRTFLRPVEHYLRDWMHTIVSKGTAGTEIALLIHACIEHGVTNEAIVQYMSAFTMPRVKGTFSPNLFAKDRLGDDHMKAFASEVLLMIPLMHAFVQDVVAPLGILADHIKCFQLMATIVDILKQGPYAAARQHIELKRLTVQHHELFKKSYGSDAVKPKWHHMLHLTDGGADRPIVSCFVLERKHKGVKKAGTWCFNDFEKPVLRSCLARQSEALQRKELYQTECLHHESSHETIGGFEIRRSLAASLRCGEVRSRDVVVLTEHRVGEVVCFIMKDLLLVQLLVFTPTTSAIEWCRSSAHEFVPASDIVSPIPWALRGTDRCRIVPPLTWL